MSNLELQTQPQFRTPGSMIRDFIYFRVDRDHDLLNALIELLLL